MQYSLGYMNWCSHDPAACVVEYDKKRNTIKYISAEEGSFSRRKKSYHFPIRSIQYCLEYFNISLEDIDVLSLDHMDHPRVHRTSDNYRLLVGDYIRSKLKITDRTKINFCDTHHLAHAYTAFLPSGFSSATVLIVDGLGSQQQTHSVYKANRESGFETVFEQKGTGIGLLYSLVTNLLGWDYGEEGKTMGLAPYGRDKATIDSSLPDLTGHRDGLLVDFSNVITRSPSPGFRCDFDLPSGEIDIYRDEYTRLAYLLQRETEDTILHLVREAIRKTGETRLCLAGGVALNCVTNELVANLTEVEDMFVQPAAGDSGIPLGLALQGLSSDNEEFLDRYLDQAGGQKFYSFSSDIGSATSGLSIIRPILEAHSVGSHEFSERVVAEELADSKVVCLCTEGIEYGPRALGHRSILSDARNPEMKAIMNEKIKHREGYRPFAPVILAEYFDQYFISNSIEHDYMLRAVDCVSSSREIIPSVIHVDNSARVQTVTNEVGKLHGILEAFHELTDVPVLINTSFNDNNEPIVFDAVDAVCCFLRTHADILVLEDEMYFRSEIANSEALLVEVLDIQKERIQNRMEKALRSLTSVGHTSRRQMEHFLRTNLNISNFYREYASLDRLCSFLSSRENSRLLVVDEYHRKLLEDLLGETNLGVAYTDLSLAIVEDTIHGIQYLPDSADVLLYNLAALYHNPFTEEYFLEKPDLWFFYRNADKLILMPTRLPIDLSEGTSLDRILHSYETDNASSIDQLFVELMSYEDPT